MPSMNDVKEQLAAPKVEAPASDATPAKAKREPVAPRTPTNCVCGVPGDKGCNGAKSTRKFAPGHDAKLVGYLTREVVAQRVTPEVALKDLAEKSGNSALLVGKLKSAIERETEKADAKARKASVEAAAAEAKVAEKADAVAASTAASTE